MYNLITDNYQLWYCVSSLWRINSNSKWWLVFPGSFSATVLNEAVPRVLHLGH